MNQSKALVAGTFLTGLTLLLMAESGPVLALALLFGGASFGLSNRYGTNPVAAAPSLISLAVEAGQGFTPPKELICVPIDLLKTALRIPVEPVKDTPKLNTDGRWKRELVLTNKLVVGKSGSGKTFYLLSDIAQFKQAHPDGRLAIADIDYGSAHPGSEPNYWFNLPSDGLNKVVYTSVNEALQAVDIFYNELERRVAASRQRKQIDKTPWFLVIDEEPAIILSLSEKKGKDDEMSEQDMFISKILQILRRGRKQGIYCSIGSQSLAVSQTAIKTDALAQFDQVILGNSIKSKKYLGWMGVTGKEADELLERVEQFAKQHKRLALTREDEQTHIRAMPHINLDDYDVSVSEADPIEEWFNLTLAENNVEGRIYDVMSMGDRTPSVLEVADFFGIPEGSCRNSNPKFVRVKQWWETFNR